MDIDVIIHRDRESGTFWAETPQLPGCFAAGHTRPELEASLNGAVALYVKNENPEELLISERVEAVERYRFSAAEGLIPV